MYPCHIADIQAWALAALSVPPTHARVSAVTPTSGCRALASIRSAGKVPHRQLNTAPTRRPQHIRKPPPVLLFIPLRRSCLRLLPTRFVRPCPEVAHAALSAVAPVAPLSSRFQSTAATHTFTTVIHTRPS
ncbi:hypothetical protein L227DRAFT_140871 [Lentinus tigrinus ALCF2SS1-6]|uniref:Uncharacterized protein n=1 Tax=Lentinus tigrinus ALCF2SS1-6 TaxID=1328759 RepID=A0A5C2ST97_9APHY|nr:hypothetical protein L227DRAFT_140871 [Lentinus tigrinus ALCF2SS1-6]